MAGVALRFDSVSRAQVIQCVKKSFDLFMNDNACNQLHSRQVIPTMNIVTIRQTARQMWQIYSRAQPDDWIVLMACLALCSWRRVWITRVSLVAGLLTLGAIRVLATEIVGADQKRQESQLAQADSERAVTGVDAAHDPPAALAVGTPRRLPPVFVQEQPKTISDLRSIEQHVSGLVTSVSKAVVTLQVGASTGSGVVISPDGLVLTVAHVCRSPGREVTFIFPDGRKAKGKTLGINHAMDSALARITEGGPWPFTPPGSLDHANLGQWVLALGHPGGFDAQRPVVARLGRIIRLGRDAVQTDCTLMAGDSGGPLFDMHGRVIGIHSRISDSTAENFHVPITTYFATWERLAKAENWGEQPVPALAWLGTRGVDHVDGCQLQYVNETGPAFKAGIKVGDIVRKLNGREIRSAEEYSAYVRNQKPGDEVNLELTREGKKISVKVKVESRRRGG